MKALEFEDSDLKSSPVTFNRFRSSRVCSYNDQLLQSGNWSETNEKDEQTIKVTERSICQNEEGHHF